MLFNDYLLSLQRKIVASLHGDYMFNFDAASGQVALDSTIDLFMRRGQKGFTRLVPTLDGIDPDEAFSSIPYEKGFAMFCHLESVVGKDAFAKFMFDFYQVCTSSNSSSRLTKTKLISLL